MIKAGDLVTVPCYDHRVSQDTIGLVISVSSTFLHDNDPSFDLCDVLLFFDNDIKKMLLRADDCVLVQRLS
jgi:hypothetical protein